MKIIEQIKIQRRSSCDGSISHGFRSPNSPGEVGLPPGLRCHEFGRVEPPTDGTPLVIPPKIAMQCERVGF